MRSLKYPFEGWVWRWVDPPEVDLPDRDDVVRNAMVLILMTLSSGGVKTKVGRTQLDVDRFNVITEKRYVGNSSYSACCDVVGGGLAMLGCRDERIINRDDDDFDGVKDAKQSDDESRSWWDKPGSRPWRPGMNVSMLYQGSISAGAWVKASSGSLPKRGDHFLLDYGVNEHFGSFVTDLTPDGNGSYVGNTVEGGQVDEFGQCVILYPRVKMYQRNGVWYLQREGKKERVLHGWIDVTKVPITAPAMLPAIGSHLGVEPAEQHPVLQWVDIMSDHESRPSRLDDEAEIDFDSMGVESKLDYLYRSYSEHLRTQEDYTRKQQDALVHMLQEAQGRKKSFDEMRESYDRMSKEVRENTAAANKLHEIVGNYSLEVKSAVVKLESRVSALEGSVIQPEQVGQLIGDIEKLSAQISNERLDRQKQDSIHEEEITGVKHKAVEAKADAEKAQADAKEAVSLAEKMKAQITPQNAAKAAVTAVALAIVEAILRSQNLDLVGKLMGAFGG